MADTKILVATVDGVTICNTTPHAITFGVYEGDEIKAVEVQSCGVLVNAKAVTETVKANGGVEFVTTKFEADEVGKEVLKDIKAAYPEAVIVGSIIAAQAYPGDVVGMVPLPGYERVAPAEKRMDPHKFSIF